MTQSTVVPNLVDAVEADLAKLALPTLNTIQGALNTVAANPGNQTILLEQEAVVVASVNTLVAESPAILPLLQQEAIAAGAASGASILGNFIAAIEAKITPPAADTAGKTA